MYIVEFERTQKDGKDCTTVRLLEIDLTNLPTGKVLADTTYLGAPPNLYMEPGTNYTVIRLQLTGPVVGEHKKAW